jgi:hypothetical protein
MGDGMVEIKTRSTRWLDRNCPCQAGFEFFDYTRIRKALTDQDTTFPDQKGQPVQNPTARWEFPYLVGIHVLHLPGSGSPW